MNDAPTGARGRPDVGPGHYLRDVVFGANDGVITTLAVIAGVAGASLAPQTALVLGAANLVADGLSMGASNYLAIKSELEQSDRSIAEERPVRHGAATMGAFVAAGGVPLLAFLSTAPERRLLLAAVFGGATLALVGAARSFFTRKPAWSSSLEMLAIGGTAGVAAWLVGWSFDRWVAP